MTTAADTPAPAGFAGYGTKSYRGFVLTMLLIVYTFNFIDRVAIDILQTQIKNEFGLVDAQLGLLKGLAFAFLYTLLGIPLARLAERMNRVTILTVCLALWSGFTSLCGMAANFTQLVAARVGVGIGEAGCTPPAQSIIADYFPAERRATALSIYSMGIHFGSMIAAIGGAWIATEFGWRTTFIVLGIPGLLLAIIVKLSVREPPRAASAVATPTFGATLKALGSKPAFWHMTMGAAITSFVGYGVSGFNIPFLERVHGLNLLQASQLSGIVFGTFAAIGTFLSGYLADRISKRHPNALAWLPAIGLIWATPIYLAAYYSPNLMLASGLIVAAIVGHYFYLGPMYTVATSVVHPNMRATAVAILLFVVNMIGYALGPPFVGWLSDVMANRALAPSALNVELCRFPDKLSDAQGALCTAGVAQGLQYAMMIGVLFFLWAAVHYLLCARTLRRDIVS